MRPALSLERLREADDGTVLYEMKRRFSDGRQTLLVIDEIGYLAYDSRNADLLFQVVSRRYKKRSLVLTTNLPYTEIIAIEGDSFRRREAQAAKLAKKPKPKS